MKTKVCGRCKKEKDVEVFCKDKNKKDGLGRCKDCQKILGKEHYQKYKEKHNHKKNERKRLQAVKIQEIKESRGCGKCGDRRQYVLEFHHIDQREKEFTIGRSGGYSWDKISKEIEKCDVLCANCHREYHFLNRK